MQRHLSTGSALVSAPMAAQRGGEPGGRNGSDVVRLLASLGDRGERPAPARPTPAQPAMWLTPAPPAMRDEDAPPASR